MAYSQDSSFCSQSSSLFFPEAEDLQGLKCGEFIAVDWIWSGKSRSLWRGRSLSSNKEVSMKIEKTSASSSVCREAAILNDLGRPGSGIPELLHFGSVDIYDCLVTERLGKPLDDMLRDYISRGVGFGLQKTVLLADQVLQRLEYIHAKGIVHRNVRPASFAFGTGNKVHHLYLTDFSLCSIYWKSSKKTYIPLEILPRAVGTPRYLSLNAHNRCQHSRRDDLESVGYMFIYVLHGSLPWIGGESLEETRQKKADIPLSKLCHGVSSELEKYLQYCRGMSFEEIPDYDMLFDLIRNCRLSETKDCDRAELDDASCCSSMQLDPLPQRTLLQQPDQPRTISKQLLSMLKGGSAGIASLALTSEETQCRAPGGSTDLRSFLRGDSGVRKLASMSRQESEGCSTHVEKPYHSSDTPARPIRAPLRERIWRLLAPRSKNSTHFRTVVPDCSK